LRAVILRVLRPTDKPALTESDAPVEPQMMDMADANAVQEVDMAYENFKDIDPLDISKEGDEAWESSRKRYAYLHLGFHKNRNVKTISVMTTMTSLTIHFCKCFICKFCFFLMLLRHLSEGRNSCWI